MTLGSVTHAVSKKVLGGGEAYVHALGRSQDENACLRLNIATQGLGSSAGSAQKGRPVMVWIHGGAFCFGAGTEPMYKGKWLTSHEDVVLVTINYRLGVFGFLPVPGGDANVGLGDQVRVCACVGWRRGGGGAWRR